MRYRSVGVYRYSWKDKDEDGNKVDFFEKIVVLMSRRDHAMISNLGFTSDRLDLDVGLRFTITGPNCCIVHGATDIIYDSRGDDIAPINVDIFLLSDYKIDPQLCISNNANIRSMTTKLFKCRDRISRTTVVILSFTKEKPYTLEIDYHVLDTTRDIVFMNGDYSVFEDGDVFEIDVNDHYDKMLLFDPKTEKQLPMVYVDGSWFDPIFEEDKK